MHESKVKSLIGSFYPNMFVMMLDDSENYQDAKLFTPRINKRFFFVFFK